MVNSIPKSKATLLPLLSLLLSCSTTVIQQEETEDSTLDLAWTLDTNWTTPDTPGDVVSKDQPLTDADSLTQDIPSETNLPDLLTDSEIPGDTTQDNGQQPDSVDDLATDLDATPPDLETDTGQPDVVVGPCGVCPAEKPLCKLGKCSCNPSPDSCNSGTYCHASGECLTCSSDSHCGSTCEDCTEISGSHFCATDNSGCVLCDEIFGCPQSQKCVGGQCVLCSTLGLCGPSCQLCSGQTPDCVNAKCSCNSSSCGQGYVCEYGICMKCTDNDPLRCGLSCAKCTGGSPHCKAGSCTLCNSNNSCGQSCSPCPAQTPVCMPDGSACVQCLYDADCPAGKLCTPARTCGDCVLDSQCTGGFYCGNYLCLPPQPAKACAGDTTPTSMSCANARIIGKSAVAVAQVSFSGSTTSTGDNLDDAPCSDGGDERFYRIYLEPGDKLELKLDPSMDYDAVLKVYQGTDCSANGTGDLVICKDSSSAGTDETYTFTATAAAWYSIVIDGAFSSSYDDYGSFQLKVRLYCLTPDCNCS